ncbi:MAG: hypothetical protein A3I09_05005 [Deltaproteobacteria bacterium RIFCSPLOWO2_02_FULL_47_10]|nr:MAG: hypothetical protein A3I09_05005 [Deltaproteobacteria bacterium RIFCSPLOWO2_02_FULL_47_10]
MDIKTMPKDIATELLRYLAEHEEFASADKNLDDISAADVKVLLRELADGLSREAASENKAAYDVKGSRDISKGAKDIISCLSPREERKLLTAFGLIDKK